MKILHASVRNKMKGVGLEKVLITLDKITK